jgi:predicted enzyme related to lactoylglutathione lyase
MPYRDRYEPGEFCWVDLRVPDLREARDFYKALFGWESFLFDMADGTPYVGWMLGGRNVAGLGPAGEEQSATDVSPAWNGYVRVNDAEAIQSRAARLGGQVVQPVVRVAEHGHTAFLSDPSGGAIFGIWQPLHHAGAQVWGGDYAACWCELATRDIETARSFYEDLFGWSCNEFTGTPSRYYIASVGDSSTGGMMEMTDAWGDMPAHWSVYFQVPDVDACCQRCEQLGGRACVPAFDTGVGRIAGCTDSQGAFFYLIRLNPRPEPRNGRH